MDLSIKRTVTGNLKFKVFRKNTHKDRYLDFNSSHPSHHKEAVVRTLMDRKNKICDPEFQEEEERYIQNVLKINNYPRHFINKVKRKMNSSNNIQNNENIKFVVAPYMKNVSERISKILQPFNMKLVSRP